MFMYICLHINSSDIQYMFVGTRVYRYTHTHRIFYQIFFGVALSTPYLRGAGAETSLTTPSRDGITQKEKKKNNKIYFHAVLEFEVVMPVGMV